MPLFFFPLNHPLFFFNLHLLICKSLINKPYGSFMMRKTGTRNKNNLGEKMNLTYLWLVCSIALACADLLLGTAYLLILGVAALLAFFISLFTDSFSTQVWGFAFFFGSWSPFLQSNEETLFQTFKKFGRSSRFE